MAIGAAPGLALQDAPEFPPVEGVPVTVSLDFFDVSGVSQRRLDESIEMNRPLGFDTATIAGFTANWAYEADDQGCSLTAIEVPVDILLRYPRWTEWMRASQDMRADWEIRQAGTVSHENGHARIAVMTAVELHDEMVQNGRAADCATLEADLEARLEAGIQRLRDRQGEYDRITGHGTRQADYDRAPAAAPVEPR
jgi:predicted secreted Zn-dependent protease